MRVPGFVSGGTTLLPQAVRGTSSKALFHVTDWLPTLVKLAGGVLDRNSKLDGLDIWSAIATGGASPRTELLHNINPACGKGYVNPNAAIRLVQTSKTHVPLCAARTLNATRESRVTLSLR